MSTHYLYGLILPGDTKFSYIGETCDKQIRSRSHRRIWSGAILIPIVAGPRMFIKALEGKAIHAFGTHVSRGGLNRNYGMGREALDRYEYASENGREIVRPTRRYAKGELAEGPFGVYESMLMTDASKYLMGTVDGLTKVEAERRRARPTKVLVAERKAAAQWYEPPPVNTAPKVLDRPERNVSLQELRRVLREG